MLEYILNPDVLKIIGPIGLVAVGLSLAIWKIFSLYVEVQEKRVKEAQLFQKEYFELTTSINRTLDILIATISKK